MSDVKIKAKIDYLKGMKQTEIAKKYGISTGTLKSWVSREKWKDEKKNIEVKTKKVATKNATKIKKVATKNKESPAKVPSMLNNVNAVKHGAYEKIMYSTMTDEEIELISGPRVDEIIELEREVDILTVRELKYLKLIKSLKDSNNDLVVVGGDKTIRTLSHKGGALELDFVEETKEITERTVYAFELINKYEAELTRIQKQKSKVIETIARIKHERVLLEISRKRYELEKFKVYGSDDEEGQDKSIKSFLSAINSQFDEKIYSDFNVAEYGKEEVENMDNVLDNDDEEEEMESIDDIIARDLEEGRK